jgi:hypothetical protein
MVHATEAARQALEEDEVSDLPTDFGLRASLGRL